MAENSRLQPVRRLNLSANRPQLGSFTGDAILSLFSGVAGRLITLAAMAIITRLYHAEEYGTWTLLLALANFFLPVATLRYEVALMLAPTKRLTNSLFLAIGLSTSGIALVVALIAIFLPSQSITALTGISGNNHIWLALIPALVWLLGIQLLLQTWLMRHTRFGWLSGAIAAQTFITALLTVTLPLLMGAVVAAAALAMVIGTIVSIAMMVYADFERLRAMLTTRLSLASLRSALKKYRVYPQYTLPYSLSIVATERITQIMLASAYSVGLVGAYYVAKQLLMAPASLLQSTLKNVLLAHSARTADIAQTRERVQTIIRLLTNLVAPMLAFGVFWLKPVVEFGLGTRWQLLPELCWLCMFPAFSLIFTGPLDRMFDLVGKQRLAVGLQITSDIAGLVTLFTSVYLKVDALTLVGALSTVVALYNCIWLCIVLRIIGCSYRTIIAQFLRFLVIFGACAAGHYLILLTAPVGYGPVIGLGLFIITSGMGGLTMARAVGVLGKTSWR
jgi:O-antigen/teichoic acid export membrane protein